MLSPFFYLEVFMKFLHLGDLHLGKIVNGFSMIDDQRYMLDQIVQLVSRRSVDAVLLAGDLYDKAVPSEEAVALLNDFLCRLADIDVQVFAVSGNHDSDVRLDFGSSLLTGRGVYIAGSYKGVIPHYDLTDEYGPVHFWLLPFVKASRIRHYHPDLDTDTYDAAVRSALSCISLNTEERNVLVAHQFVTAGGQDPVLSGSEMQSTVGTVEKTDASAFYDFDYTALGHIHRSQRVGRNTIRYSGSLLKYSLSEAGQQKAFPLVTLGEKGAVEVETVTLPPKHDMRCLKGPFDQLTDPANVVDPEDYIYITLTDEELILDAILKIRKVYPNVMKLDYDNRHTAEIENFDITQTAVCRSLHETADGFCRLVLGRKPTEEEWKLIREAAKEAGIEDETD